MPAEWRRLLLFRYVLGLQSADLSRSLRRPRAEIERGLADAHQALRRNFIAQLDGPMLQRGRA
jgi:DNA-directed RNA polymerase specialized sigma24 family protein